MEQKPEPKRRNLEATRERILAAAAEIFAQSGYAQTSLRQIAARAGIAPSLVSRYFGTKAGLFEQALMHVVATNTVFTWDKARFGETMADLIPRRSNTNITVALVLALADPETREIARRVFRAHMIQPLVDWLGPPDAEERAMELFSLMTGFTIHMHGLAPDPLPERSTQWLARTLQAIVDGDD